VLRLRWEDMKITWTTYDERYGRVAAVDVRRVHCRRICLRDLSTASH